MEKLIDMSYKLLFNAISMSIRELEKSKITPEIERALEILKDAQKTTEEIYINSDDE